LLTIGAIECCTGVVRQGVMQWFPIYASEVWALPKEHYLIAGRWEHLWLIGATFVVAAISFALAARRASAARGYLIVFGALAFLAPFLQGGWGGLLFVSGVIGGNVAGWVSDLFFQSRRGPAAGGLYAFLALCVVGMLFVLSPPTNVVATAEAESGLLPGDKVVSVAGKPISGWADVRAAVACWQPTCKDSSWDAKECVCSTKVSSAAEGVLAPGPIPAVILRDGQEQRVNLPDPKPVQRAGDQRLLKARPELPLSPYWLGTLVFLISLCVIGTHGLLSGTATIDFGGRKAAATAGGLIDGCVYLGTAVQALSLGFLTTKSWSYWPPFMLPFSVVGFLLCLRIWNAKPRAAKPTQEPALEPSSKPEPAQAA